MLSQWREECVNNTNNFYTFVGETKQETQCYISWQIMIDTVGNKLSMRVLILMYVIITKMEISD